MNETLRVRLQVDGNVVPVDGFSADGIRIGREFSASPRGLDVGLQPVSPGTQARIEALRRMRGWAPGTFRFNVAREGDALVCSGIDSLSFPSGRYSLRLRIADLESLDQPLDVDVPGEVTAKFKTDPRQVRLLTSTDDFDSRIKAVVLDPASRVDGETITQWLGSDARPRRKACLLNVLAKLRAAKGPAPKTSLIDEVRSVFFADVDRIYVLCTAGLLSNLRALAADPAKPFMAERSPRSDVHRKLLDWIGPAHGGHEADAADFQLESFRQEGRPSLQAVVAIPPGGDPNRSHYADLDLDLGNPLQDLAGAFIHFGEILNPGRTDHLKLAGKLAKGSTKDFRYYEVVESR